MNNLWIYASGFEAGGPHTPSNIDPWSIIGDDSSIFVATDRTSCFTRNIVALRMEVLCDDCPVGGVGIYNPGFWGMVICHHILLVHIIMKWID
jgi:alpha-L-arabinofuranosidase